MTIIPPERNPNDDRLMIDCLHQASQAAVSHKHLWFDSITFSFEVILKVVDIKININKLNIEEDHLQVRMPKEVLLRNPRAGGGSNANQKSTMEVNFQSKIQIFFQNT